ncbi:hypothetical protein FIC87_09955 [Eggerthella lenta]|uniref:Mannosyl-glycoprotein endo-beta-N-acetylglucosamidase-like domain-containing protein n=1 Tax=Eggerthella lenta TaxID=84112 RepID=A0A5C5BU01_EGGLN|nr:cell wall-binding repeat-containing protein [Eggerthella lenta]TNU89940.1 hypothetical protein FIC87_09955 [Eggerthella lenta]
MMNSATKSRRTVRALLASALAILLCAYSVPVVPARAYADDAQAAARSENAADRGAGSTDDSMGEEARDGIEIPAENEGAKDAGGAAGSDSSAAGGETGRNAIGDGAGEGLPSASDADGSDGDGKQGPDGLAEPGVQAAESEGEEAEDALDAPELTEEEQAGAFSAITDEEIAKVLSALEASAASEEDEGVATLSLSGSGGVKTFGGATMFETAVAEAKAAYPSSDTVILAGPGDSWVDALAGAGLAGALDCPILFAERTSLHPATKAALQQMGVKNAVVLGGTAAVSDGVVEELKGMGIALKARLGGDDCYDTQMKIYNYGLDNGLWASNMVIVATGGHYGDALSASPVAFAKKAPIFLVQDGDLPAAQRKALTDAYKGKKVSSAVIVGGTAAVSIEAEGFLRELGSRTRLDGPTQYETSSKIAAWAVKNQGLSWNSAAFTTGKAPYDALAGSVLQGKTNSVMLLVDDSQMAAVKEASVNKGSISGIRFFGGTAAISPSLRTLIMSYLSDKITYENAGVSLSRMAKLEKVAAKTLNPDVISYEDSEFYQFAVLNEGYSGKVTAEQIDAFIAKNCTYSESAYGVTSKLRGTGKYFIEAAKTYGVNEVYLLSHAILESAWGCSTLAQGKVPGYKGYLNFYGIGAYDLDPDNGGAALAKSNKWTTPQKAIVGAAQWIAKSGNRYLNNSYHQNTLYKMRWNYEQAAKEGVVWKQYATSTTWASGIANVMAGFYSYAGIDKGSTGLRFLVPLYS